MTDAPDYSAILNDPEVDLLADLFLHPFCSDRGTRAYRRFRNTVILTANGVPPQSAYVILAELEDSDGEQVAADVEALLDNLSAPPSEIFNAAFARAELLYGKPLEMPEYSRPDDVLLFLGTVFLYLKYTYFF